jgi:uncharacterized protein YukE
MSKIHMETEHVRSLARLIEHSAYDIADSVQDLKRSSRRLSNTWIGGSRSRRFLSEFNQVIKEYDKQGRDLLNYMVKLNREVDEWISVDSDGQTTFTSISSFLIGGVAGGIIADVTYNSVGDEFDWFSWGRRTFKTVLKVGGEIPYDSISKISYDGIGRWINQIAGSSRAGWVGNMDSIGHIIKNPAISKGIPLGLGIVSDLMDGDDLRRAVGSEVMEMGITIGIGAIPVVGEIYLGYQLGLGAANLVAGGMDLFGFHNEAVVLQNTLDKLDFADWFADGAYDWLLAQENKIKAVVFQ